MVTGSFTLFRGLERIFRGNISACHEFDFLCSAHYVSAKNKSLIRKGLIMAISFGTVNQAGKEFLGNTVTSVTAVTQEIQTIANEAAEYSKNSFDAGSALIQKLGSVKSLEQAFDAQTKFSKNAYESFVAQATKFGELYANLAMESFRPYEAAVAKIRK